MIEEVKSQTLVGSNRAVKISETLNLHKPVDVPEGQIHKPPKALSAPSTRNATPEHSKCIENLNVEVWERFRISLVQKLTSFFRLRVTAAYCKMLVILYTLVYSILQKRTL